MEKEFSPRFVKQYKKANKKIQSAFEKRFAIFLKNPLDPRLRNHALAGNYKGFRSINITGDWRALYSERRAGGKTVIVFHFLGTHSQLYR